MFCEDSRDKHKDNGIRLEKSYLLKLSKEVRQMAENDSDLLNAVYREISEKRKTRLLRLKVISANCMDRFKVYIICISRRNRISALIRFFLA
jgi:hypothetical protein